MESPLNRIRVLQLFILLLFPVAAARAQQAPINCKGPLSEDQLIGLLKGGVAVVRVQAFVKTCGIGFPFTPNTEQRLRAAGASDAVIAEVRRQDETKRQREEERLWAEAKEGRSAERLQEYMKRFPDGDHVPEAREKLAQLKRLEQLRTNMRQAKKEGRWQEAEPWLKELSELQPEDEEMRSWESWVTGERTRWEGMTLAAAKQEVASLEKKIEKVRKTTEVERDEALQQTDEKYRSERENAAQPDIFITTAEREQRLQSLDSKYKADREAIEKRYTGQAEAQSEGYRKQAEALKARTYVEEGAKVEFVSYTADMSRLAAKVNGEEYWFRIAPEAARELVPRLSTAKVHRYFGEDRAQERVLVDSTTAMRFNGISRIGEERARMTWTDPQTGLRWPLTDNGSDVNWNEAASYCQQLRLGEFSDWRLPEIGELEQIYDASSEKQYKAKGGIQLSNWWAWSATKEGSGSAWGFDFGLGRRYSLRLDLRNSTRALCVRRSGE
jgi:hypothetical protein